MMSSAKEISQASSETGGRLPNVQEKGKLEAEVANLQAQIATRQAEVEAPAAAKRWFWMAGFSPPRLTIDWLSRLQETDLVGSEDEWLGIGF